MNNLLCSSNLHALKTTHKQQSDGMSCLLCVGPPARPAQFANPGGKDDTMQLQYM